MKVILFGLIAVALVAIAASLVLSGQFKGKIEARRRMLAAGQISSPPDQAAIPQIMRAFAARNGATVGGPPLVVSQQADEMKLSQDQPFFAVAARQVSGTRDPGFVWEATALLAHMVPIRVVDAHAEGKGWLEVRIAGAMPVANATGPESDKGEMMRFLSELAWNPDAILNAAALKWKYRSRPPAEQRRCVTCSTPMAISSESRLMIDLTSWMARRFPWAGLVALRTMPHSEPTEFRATVRSPGLCRRVSSSISAAPSPVSRQRSELLSHNDRHQRQEGGA
jgi:hypothetical protein